MKRGASVNQVENYISVDVETAGPNPGKYAMLSIGACAIFDLEKKFYVDLQPDKENYLPDALFVSGLKMDKLKEHGDPPKTAMQKFADWVADITPPEHKPIFVAFNAPFDWMFVNDYFHRYLEYNPFGHSALDIKACYMGLKRLSWNQTSMRGITQHYFGGRSLTHNALRDALDQAEIFRMMMDDMKGA